MECLRHLERLDGTGQTVTAVRSDEQPPIEQHAYGLDRVQRDALGALENARAKLFGQPGHEAEQQLVPRVLGERLEEERAEVAGLGAPTRAALEQLRSCKREHEDRVVPRTIPEGIR